jgi:hypothetical protein
LLCPAADTMTVVWYGVADLVRPVTTGVRVAGILEKEKWMRARSDNKKCPSCRGLDRHVIKLAQPFVTSRTGLLRVERVHGRGA